MKVFIVIKGEGLIRGGAYYQLEVLARGLIRGGLIRGFTVCLLLSFVAASYRSPVNLILISFRFEPERGCAINVMAAELAGER